jgi:hypothetical protein
MDAQGGEKPEDITFMLELLVRESRQFADHADDLYYLGDETLGTINLLQGFDPFVRLARTRIEHAFIIWNQAAAAPRDALLEANGFKPFDGPLLPGLHIVFDNDR